MQEIKVLGSNDYDVTGKNYGDCFIINTGTRLYLYDCGSVEHAKRVLNYMDKNGYEKVTVILSHNDSDHFDGIPYLHEHDVIDQIYTVLLLKYTDKILNRIGDGRRSREGIKEAIKQKYDNISELSGYPLCDIYLDGHDLCDEIEIVGPDKEDMLETVAHDLDPRESDTTCGETNVNATSIHLKIDMFGRKILLCGDAPFERIENLVSDFDAIQLPHHGKAVIADKIFEKMLNNIHVRYIVSDNTGNSNGGSDGLKKEGHLVSNTKEIGDIKIDAEFFMISRIRTGGALGI